jgi:Ceramidase
MKKKEIATPKIVALITVMAFIVVFTFLHPIAQNIAYHNFANDTIVFGINNFWNVVSNTGFIIAGIFGFSVIKKYNAATAFNYILFSGFILTGLGSAYYHYNPSNTTLVWDRLPMTIVFTTFFAQLYSWYLCPKNGFKIWIGTLLIGVFSVFYWQYTEYINQGDLRLYAIVQYLPMLLLLVILISHHNKHTYLLNPLLMVMFFYIIAKFFENFDTKIFEINNVVAGHPIKHLAAAMATFCIVIMVKKYHFNNDNKTKSSSNKL